MENIAVQEVERKEVIISGSALFARRAIVAEENILPPRTKSSRSEERLTKAGLIDRRG